MEPTLASNWSLNVATIKTSDSPPLHSICWDRMECGGVTSLGMSNMLSREMSTTTNVECCILFFPIEAKNTTMA